MMSKFWTAWISGLKKSSKLYSSLGTSKRRKMTEALKEDPDKIIKKQK